MTLGQLTITGDAGVVLAELQLLSVDDRLMLLSLLSLSCCSLLSSPKSLLMLKDSFGLITDPCNMGGEVECSSLPVGEEDWPVIVDMGTVSLKSLSCPLQSLELGLVTSMALDATGGDLTSDVRELRSHSIEDFQFMCSSYILLVFKELYMLIVQSNKTSKQSYTSFKKSVI